MFFEGDVTSLVEAMRLKRELIKSNATYEGPRILFIGGGGVMYGCEAGGTVTAFAEAGYGDVFDWVLGLSTSAPGVTYFLSGNPRVGTSIYYEECCTKEFLDPFRIHKPVDTVYLDRVFRGETGKPYNLNRVFEHRTELLIGVTNARTGKQNILRPKTGEELYRVILASISIPGITGRPIVHQGRGYTDGAMSNPLPVKQLIGALNPTHVLVIPNRTKDVTCEVPRFERVLNDVLFRSRISPAMREMMRRRRARLREALRWLRQDCPIPYVVAWSEGTIGKFERDPCRIKAAAVLAEEQWLELLA
jgi:predicted patatin/cPLA2 family phospholipase